MLPVCSRFLRLLVSAERMLFFSFAMRVFDTVGSTFTDVGKNEKQNITCCCEMQLRKITLGYVFGLNEPVLPCSAGCACHSSTTSQGAPCCHFAIEGSSRNACASRIFCTTSAGGKVSSESRCCSCCNSDGSHLRA